jgi:hypothetical protein
VPSHGDGVEAVKCRRALAYEREKLVWRKKERGRGADGDGVDICLLAKNELDLSHRLAREASGQHHATPPFAGHDGHLTRNDEMQALRVLPVGDELLAPFERPRLKALDEAGALRCRDRGDERRRPPEIGDRMAPTKSGELDPELGMLGGNGLDCATPRYEQNRSRRCDHGGCARQV